MSSTVSKSRRSFLASAGAGILPAGKRLPAYVPTKSEGTAANRWERANRAYEIRRETARRHLHQPMPADVDEQRYSARFANYSKALPHNDAGEVDTAAYATLIRALRSDLPSDFVAVPLRRNH